MNFVNQIRLFLTFKNGTHSFFLNYNSNQFELLHKDILISESTSEYSINSSYRRFCSKKFFTYIKKHPVMFFSLLRLIPIPSQLPDLIPVIFKVNNLNYFLGKLIGSLVSYLLLVNFTNQLLINLDLKSHLVDQKYNYPKNYHLMERMELLLNIFSFFRPSNS